MNQIVNGQPRSDNDEVHSVGVVAVEAISKSVGMSDNVGRQVYDSYVDMIRDQRQGQTNTLVETAIGDPKVA